MEIVKNRFKDIIDEIGLKDSLKLLDIKEKDMNRMIEGTQMINLKTAEKVLTRLNSHLGLSLGFEDIFYTENIRGNEDIHERKAEFHFGINKLSELDVMDVMKYILEGRKRGFMIEVLLWILAISSTIATIYYIYYK